MDLHQLRYFVAAAEAGNFTRAAEREAVTQPTLSEQVAKLESKLNRLLFDRLGRKVALTAAGEQLLPRAKAILAAVADAERELKDDADGGILRVGAIPTIAPYVLPAACRAFVAKFPRAGLRLREDLTDRVLAELVSADLDLAITATPPPDARLHVEPLFEEPLLVALPAGHRLAAATAITLSDILAEPFLLLDEVHCFGDQVLSLCRGGGKEPRVVCRGEQIGTLLALVAAGVGVSVVPRSAAEFDTSALRVYRPFTAPVPTRTVCGVWHKHRARSAAARGFAAVLAAGLVKQ